MTNYSPSTKLIYREIYKVLQDGQPHSVDDLHKLCGPSCRRAVMNHVYLIRKRLLKPHEAIACIIANKRIHYQLFYRYDLVEPIVKSQ